MKGAIPKVQTWMQAPYRELITQDLSLPTPPAVAARILQAIREEGVSGKELGEIVSTDPALTVKILKLVNSPFYGFLSRVNSIERAVGILGINAVKNIALSFVVMKSINRLSTSDDGFNMQYFWKRAITSAVSAELLSQNIGVNKENTFVAGLLMDIGVPVMYSLNPFKYKRVMTEKRTGNINTTEAERRVFGFDHQLVGKELLKNWYIPEVIYRPIGTHHEPESDSNEMVKILYISDIISSIYHGTKNTEKLYSLRRLLEKWFGVSDDVMEKLLDEVGERTVEILDAFEIPAGNMKPYSLLLQEANEELQKLNLSYENLIIELKRAKQNAEELARQLMEANRKLQELAFRDGLTGLYNHRFFQETLDKELKRVERYRHPLAVLMIDIDHFKRINDTYGHPKGDVVLKEIGRLIMDNVRSTDIPARYGGEEFSIILPETTYSGAFKLAERLRKRVEELSFNFRSEAVNVTVSIGGASLSGRCMIKKNILLETADRALYESKSKGRNRTTLYRFHDTAIF